MKYLDVLSGFNKPKGAIFDPAPFAIKQSDGVLVSLKKGALKSNLLKGKYHHTPDKIQDYKDRHPLADIKGIWVDSGGYDLLNKSDANEQYLDYYLNYYLNYFEDYKLDYHKIFSLDFQPTIRKANAWINTKDKILKWNERSLVESISLINNHKELQDKFYFVYHCKTRSLYEIWNKLYDRLNLKDIVKNRAIGGLVSAHQLSRRGRKRTLYFSPLIAPAFNALNDYIEAGFHDNDFTLHFLGVSNKIDRFVVILLEELFKLYLNHLGINKSVQFTYDTRTYSTHADLKSRTGEIFSYLKNEHDKPLRYPDPTFIGSDRLKDVYPDETAFNAINDEMENISWDDKMIATAHYRPIFIWSNRNLDNYYNSFINEQDIPEKLFNATSTEDISEYLERLFNKIVPSRNILKTTPGYKDFLYEENLRAPLYDIWSDDMMKKIITSCESIFLFNDWFKKHDRDPEALNKLMLQFIDDMGIAEMISS